MIVISQKFDETNIITPGLYDISNDTYHNGPGISRSGILEFRKSPLHYWNRYLNLDRPPEKRSAAKDFGAAFHPYILEPHLFAKDFVYEDQKIDGRTTAGKKYREEFQLKNADKTILTHDEYMRLLGMTESLNRNPTAVELLKGALYEKSMYWTDEETGVLCKCRPDIYHINMICDLKSAADAEERAFRNAIFSYGYHIQAAMMQDAAFSVFKKIISDFLFIVIEKSPPYAVAIYLLDEPSIDLGRQMYKSALVDYKHCLQTNTWPGYPIKQISLPAYAFYQ